MSKELPGFNSEQVDAELQRLWRENPYKEEYDEIEDHIQRLREVQKQFVPKDASASRLMLMVFGGSEDKETLSRMNNQQLCEFAMEHVYGHLTCDTIQEWTFDEMVKRLGYKYQGKE